MDRDAALARKLQQKELERARREEQMIEEQKKIEE